MSRLPPIKTSLIENSLLKKGFVKDNTHHKMFWLRVGNRNSRIYTRTSHGQKECDPSLLKAIQKQLKLRKDDTFLPNPNEFLRGFLECPVSGDEYVKKLRLLGELKSS